ncbi:MAG: hypothetical protein H0X39_16085 [Actinobacteria bacterium]|nr:hypothetical protein [Actinomycetota bacterium]
MLVLAIVLAALAGPPHAYVATASGHVPLAVSSWCWGPRCGAPIAASARTAIARRGTAVEVQLAFVPKSARVAVAGAPVKLTRHGDVLTWIASRAGGMTISVTGAKGWVIYVGRLVVR